MEAKLDDDTTWNFEYESKLESVNFCRRTLKNASL